MNIKQARKEIQKAIKENATKLDLNRRKAQEKLTSDNLEELMPEILNVSELKRFEARGNKLSNISFLAKLKKLEILVLGKNDISDLSGLMELKNLKRLYLSENRIRNILPIQRLTRLDSLGLGSNEINDISALSELNDLQYLNLSANQINDISPLTNLKKLRNLSLLKNPALEEKIPVEILLDNKNRQRIINYWLSIIKGVRPLNEAKVVVVGQGSVGKTTLIERLINGKFIVPEKTDGIDIQKWKIAVNGHDVQLNIWDFGGQEIMHATHQFFLTKRSLYVLALDCRLDKDENRLEYWLRKIGSLSESSPVIIVGSKVDEHQFDIARRDLLKKFPYIKGFYGVSAKTGEGIEEFKEAITRETDRLKGVYDELPLRWFDVKAKLEEMDEDLISFERYSEICAEKRVDGDNEDTDLVELLHDLGVVLCFHRDKRLQDTNVLQPEWVTNGVYKILNARIVFDNDGILRMDMLPGILDEIKYPKAKHRFIIEMMRKFELCFEIGEKEFLIPDLLRQEGPDTGEWEDSLRFQYQYEVFFSSLLTRFIVRANRRIDCNIYWRNGVLLAYKVGGEIKNKALIKADSTAAKISIAVSGEQNTRRDFLSLIREIFEGVHGTIPNLKFQEKVPIPGHGDIVADYKHLIALEAKGVSDYYPEGLTNPIPIKSLLRGINTKVDLRIAGMSKDDVDKLLRVIAKIVDFFDRKLDHDHAELHKKLDYNQKELAELINTFRNSGPKGKIKASIPLLKQLGLDISFEKDFKPDDVIRRVSNFLHGKEPTELKLEEGNEPKKLKE